MQSNKKNSRLFHAETCLRHLTIVSLTMSKPVCKDFFSSQMKTEILKLVKQFSLEKEFHDIVGLCETNVGSAPAKKPGKKTGRPKKVATSEEAESNSSESGKAQSRKRKRNPDDGDAGNKSKKPKHKKADNTDESSNEEIDIEMSKSKRKDAESVESDSDDAVSDLSVSGASVVSGNTPKRPQAKRAGAGVKL
jgi:hypothetical protein